MQNNQYPNQSYNGNFSNNNQQQYPFSQQYPQQANNLMNPSAFRGATNNYNYQDPGKLHEGEYYDGQLSLEQRARKGFITKVYGLLSMQLVFTTIIGYIGYNSLPFQQVLVSLPIIIIVSVGLLALSIVIGCCTDFFRKYALPIFIAFTVLMSLLVAISICGFKSKVVLLAVGITLVVTIGLTIFACTTSTDVTGCGPYLMVFGLVMLVFGIVAIFWKDPIVQLIYSCLGALMFGIYLIYDTQLVLGKHKYSYSLDDAYLAAIQLYIDIIELFLNILRIVQYFDR